MTFSRWSKASRRSEFPNKPSVEIFVAVSAVNVAMIAVNGGKGFCRNLEFSSGLQKGTIDCIDERDKRDKAILYRAIRGTLQRRVFGVCKRDVRIIALWDDKKATYYEIKVRQCSGSSAIETVSRMGLPEMLSPVSVSLAVLLANEDGVGNQTLLCHESHILRQCR